MSHPLAYQLPSSSRTTMHRASKAVILLITLQSTQAFFFGGGQSSCGCSPAPACPAPAPCPAPVASPCPSYQPCAVARAAPTVHNAQPILQPLPDELELRAAAFGIPIGSAGPPVSNINQLERLVDRSEGVQAREYRAAEDADLFAGLRRSSEIRRAPTVKVSHQEDQETTTVAAEVSTVRSDEVESSTAIPTTDNKCNSQVLHRLMLDNMSDNSSESKRNINLAAETKFGGSVDVICSRGHFSYVFSSNLYCEASKGLTTCIAFRQATI